MRGHEHKPCDIGQPFGSATLDGLCAFHLVITPPAARLLIGITIEGLVLLTALSIITR